MWNRHFESSARTLCQLIGKQLVANPEPIVSAEQGKTAPGVSTRRTRRFSGAPMRCVGARLRSRPRRCVARVASQRAQRAVVGAPTTRCDGVVAARRLIDASQSALPHSAIL